MHYLARTLPISPSLLRFFFIAALACSLFSFAVPKAQAASLTEPQIQAILTLLVSFDVDRATINDVNNILHGTSFNTPFSVQAPASGQKRSAPVHSTLSLLQQFQAHIAELIEEKPSITTPISVPRYVLPPNSTEALMFNAAPVDVSVNACRRITTSGHYTVESNIVQSPDANQPCISIHDTSDVVLDCAEHSITGTYSSATIFAQNVTNLAIKNCSVNSSVDGYVLYLQNITNGHISNNKIGGFIAQMLNSSGLDVSGNTFTSVYQQIYTSNSTIANNNFSRLDHRVIAANIVSAFGRNNQIIGNVLDGNAQGDFNTFEAADDGIVIEDEYNDIIWGNSMKNYFDCGIETVGMFADSRVENNSITNTGNCGIGGWYWSSWKGNTVSNNTADRVVRVLDFLTYYGLRPQGFDEQHIMPADTAIYFKDNAFIHNTVTNPKEGGAWVVITLPTLVSAVPGETLPTSSQLITENNVFTNNNFGADYISVLYPSSMFVNGGGNICKGFFFYDQTTIPIGCMMTPPPVPTATLTQTAATTTVGESFRVSWSSRDTSGCTVQKQLPDGTPVINPWGIGTSGSIVDNSAANEVGLTHIWIDCTGSGGTVHQDLYHTVVVISPPPRIFSATPTSGATPLSVNFSYTYNSDIRNGQYTVDFGDGTSGQMTALLTMSACQQGTDCIQRGSWVVNHTYTSAGVYTASLVSTPACRNLVPPCATPSQIIGTIVVTATAAVTPPNTTDGFGNGTAQPSESATSSASQSKIIQNFDYAGMMASVMMAPFSLMIDSLTDIFVMLGVGQ